MKAARILIFISLSVFLVSCHSSVENAATAQTANAPIREPQTNVKISESNVKKSESKNSGRLFFKTSIVNNAYQDDSGETADAGHAIEFRDDSDGISVYIDDKKKVDLKLEGGRTKVSADFRESGGVRYFILIVSSAASGTCGDAGFAIVKIDENLNVKISEPNENACQGEFYRIGIETVSREKTSYRQISIGDLKFNLETFDWLKTKAPK